MLRKRRTGGFPGVSPADGEYGATTARQTDVRPRCVLDRSDSRERSARKITLSDVREGRLARGDVVIVITSCTASGREKTL